MAAGGSSAAAMERRAVRLAGSGMARRIGRTRWEVDSESSPGSRHTVDVTDSGIRCTCPYHGRRDGAACKHARAVELLIIRAPGPAPGRRRPGRRP